MAFVEFLEGKDGLTNRGTFLIRCDDVQFLALYVYDRLPGSTPGRERRLELHLRHDRLVQLDFQTDDQAKAAYAKVKVSL